MENKTSGAGGFVRREYPIKEPASADPAVQAIAGELVKAMSPGAPGNRLGRLAGGQPGPESLRVESAHFAAKYFKQLITPEELVKLQALAAVIDRERKLGEFHSLPITQARIDNAVRAYASNPTAANLKQVREEKTFCPQDHTLIQFQARQRMNLALQEQLPPIGVAVYDKAVKLLTGKIEALAAHDAEEYSEWGLSPVPSVLQHELERLHSEFSNSLKGYRNGHADNDGLTGLPRFIVQAAAEQPGK